MGYIGKTLGYLKKSFPLLAAVMLAPAAALAFFVRPVSMITFLPMYARTEVASFLDVLWLIFDRYTLTYVFPLLLGFVLSVLGVSLGLSVVERHFRVGELALKAPLKAVNNSIFPVTANLFILLVIYMAAHFLFVCLVTLTHFLLSGAGRPGLADVAVTAVLSVTVLFLLLRLLQSFLFWAPLMLLYGYSFLDAVIASSSLCAKAPTGIWTGVAFPFVCVMTATSLAVFFRAPPWVNILTAGVSYLFLLVYLTAFVMVAVFDLGNMERRDMRPKYGAG